MEKLPKLLTAWAMEEMKFQTTTYSSSGFTQLPTEQDFEQLCKKPLDDVWRYVIKHIRSKQTVKEVKGNIELNKKFGLSKDLQKSRDITEAERKLQQEKAELTRELTSCNSDIDMLQKEMSHLTNEVLDTECSYQSVHQRIQDQQKKESVLELVNKCSDEKIAKYLEYDQRVKKKIESLSKKSNGQEKNYVTRGGKNKAGDLETESCRNVRLTCEAIEEFLHRIVDGSLADKYSLENAQKQLWEAVKKTSSDLSVSSIISAVVSNTEYAAKDLREKTLHVNITEDAEKLSFSYDKKTGLQDISSRTSMQKCVQDLLLAGNEQHVMRWFKEQEHLNEEWKLSARIDDIMMDIRKQVHRINGDNPRSAQLANSYIDAQIKLAEERSVAPCLKEVTENLIERIQKAKQERNELRLKHEQIQNFRNIVERKQNIISTLARQNSGAPVRLDSQKKQVIDYILSRSMNSHATEVRHLTDDLKTSLVTELVKFASLEMSCFVTVPLDSNIQECVLNLSIAPNIHPLAHEKLRMYTDVATALGFPRFKSTDSLFMHILHIHDRMQELDFIQQHRDNSLKVALAAANTTDDIGTFIDLCHTAKVHDQTQCDKLLPKLQKKLEIVSSVVNKMPEISKQVDTWWEQPAQYTTPWVKVEGMTFDQWMQRWRVAVTQLNKKMMEDKSYSQKQTGHHSSHR